MPASCSAYGCTNRHYRGTPTHFHSFPFSREKVLKAWIHAVRRKNFKPAKSSVICSTHFRETDFIKNNRGWVLKRDAVPSVFENFPAHLQPKSIKERRTHSKNYRNLLIMRSTSKNSVVKRLIVVKVPRRLTFEILHQVVE